jgi:predicted transcriptional regulator
MSSAVEMVTEYLAEAACISTVRNIAFYTKLSESTANAACKKLLAAGEVTKGRVYVTAGFQYRRSGYVNGYKLVDPVADAVTETVPGLGK